jgi:hypothetical protein
MLRKLRILLLLPAALGFAFVILSGQTASPPAPTATPTTPPCWDPGSWVMCQDLWRKHAAGTLTENEKSMLMTCRPSAACVAALGECQRLIREAEAGNELSSTECEFVVGCPDFPHNLQPKCGPPSTSPPPEPLPLPGEPQTLAPEDSSSSIMPSADPPIGPTGSPTPGGGADACNHPTGYAQPPDVAADVGPSEAVELLNFGIWVIQRGTGTVLSQQDLYSFWSGNSPDPAKDFLLDTQVAFEPISQRWVATTLDLTGDPSCPTGGNVYFGFSQSSDAAGTWNEYKLPAFCSNPANPVPDMPILGYNQKWLAIDALCFPSGAPCSGATPGNDQLVLVPASVLTQSTAPTPLPTQTPTGAPPSPFTNFRPSRDVSGKAGKNLYLVEPVVALSGTSLPEVKVTAIDDTGAFAPPGRNNTVVVSPGSGVLGSDLGVSNAAQHDNCGATSGCAINLFGINVTNVVLQTKSGTGGHHYLATSFHAGDRTNNTAQSLYFIGDVDSFSGFSPTWNDRFLDAAGKWFAYPTIAMDSDLDTAFTETTFAFGSAIQPSWFMSKGFSSTNGSWAPILGSGPLPVATSTGSYTGQLSCTPTPSATPTGPTATPTATPTGPTPTPTAVTQRWGDYMTTVWDPNFSGPQEKDGFWTVQEYSTGGSNESTNFVGLQDPLPYYAGQQPPVGPGGNVGENECQVANTTCYLTYSAPSGAQAGDVFIAVVGIVDEKTDSSHLVLPSGWTLFSLSNLGTNEVATPIGSGGIVYQTSFLAAHVYGGSNDPGQYSVGIKTITNLGEMYGFMVSYRGASTTLSNYTARGYPGNSSGSATASFTIPALNVQTAGVTLLNIFDGDASCPGSGNDEGTDSTCFSSFSGNPALTDETTPLNTLAKPWFMGADVPVANSGTFGGYTFATSTSGYLDAFQLLIPE